MARRRKYLNVMICGSRDLSLYLKTRQDVIKLMHEYPDHTIRIVTGMAKHGADDIAYHLARWDLRLPWKEFPADWDKHGRKAGMLRNVDMIVFSDEVLAYWDGTSKGTKHSIKEANKRKMDPSVLIVDPQDVPQRYEFFSLSDVIV